MIAWVALAAYLLLAIGTYSVGDPGWSSTGNGAGISNSAGATGAWIADVLLSLFGYVSYLFPVLLGFRAWALLRERQSPFVFDWLLVSIRSVGFVLVVLAGTGHWRADAIPNRVRRRSAAQVISVRAGSMGEAAAKHGEWAFVMVFE